VFAKSSTASSRQRGVAQGPLAAKPTEPSKTVRRRTWFHVVRGRRRKASVEEMSLSMEVAPDRAAVGSSRTLLQSDLGAARMCGPLRRDSQAGASVGGSTGATLGRSTTAGVEEQRHHGRAKSKRQSVDSPEPLRRRETAGCSIVRPTGGNSFRAGGVGGTERIRSCEARPHRERTRHGCSRLSSRWQKPVTDITREEHATPQGEVGKPNASQSLRGSPR
jgi:hypothetical protein